MAKPYTRLFLLSNKTGDLGSAQCPEGLSQAYKAVKLGVLERPAPNSRFVTAHCGPEGSRLPPCRLPFWQGSVN